MKGSTLRRSNLSKEKLAMIETLKRYRSEYQQSGTETNENKHDELDVLWQNFKIASRAEKPPMAYFATGVFVGVVATLIMAIIISLIVGYSPLNDINITTTKTIKPTKEKLNFTFVPADTKQETEIAQQLPQTKEYTVQSGDSLEGISIKFYGGYDLSKINAIKEANKLPNADAIAIGQKLIIPIESH